MSDDARRLVWNLTEGRSVPRGWYSHLTSLISKEERDLIDWFVEEDGYGYIYISEEAHVGLKDRIGE